MLPKKNRADKKLIETIFKNGKFINSPNLTLKYVDAHLNISQIGFVVPKTVAKRAVDRNLLKRRGYSVFKRYLDQPPVGFKGAFIFGKKSLSFFGGRKTKKYNPIQNLENEIKIILNKIN